LNEADDYINLLIDHKLNMYIQQVNEKDKQREEEYSNKFDQLDTLINNKVKGSH